MAHIVVGEISGSHGGDYEDDSHLHLTYWCCTIELYYW
jgi:hypothetical protein